MLLRTQGRWNSRWRKRWRAGDLWSLEAILNGLYDGHIIFCIYQTCRTMQSIVWTLMSTHLNFIWVVWEFQKSADWEDSWSVSQTHETILLKMSGLKNLWEIAEQEKPCTLQPNLRCFQWEQNYTVVVLYVCSRTEQLNK